MSAPSYTKPLPAVDPDGRPFWDYCRQHQLRAQRCRGCGRFRWPPRGVCPVCCSWEYDWQLLDGRGTVASFVAVHRAPPAFAADVPYVIAQVDLDATDGCVRMTSNILDCPWQEVRVGMAVSVVFDDVTPECTLFKFRP